ncbi:hypothetical protein TNCV_1855671 [Trichonephila clavipes]|nr:hypothetical protein TNCV_1855671 [Trichonephila clavipes]
MFEEPVLEIILLLKSLPWRRKKKTGFLRKLGVANAKIAVTLMERLEPIDTVIASVITLLGRILFLSFKALKSGRRTQTDPKSGSKLSSLSASFVVAPVNFLKLSPHNTVFQTKISVIGILCSLSRCHQC